MSEEHDTIDETGTGLAVVDADEPYDSGDRRHVKKREVVAKRNDSSDRMVVRQIMGSREGRAWMHKKLVLCHITRSSFATNSLMMAFEEGERSIGLQLYAEVIGAAPERYIEMMKEANDAG